MAHALDYCHRFIAYRRAAHVDTLISAAGRS
jgi:hypothetical protein